MKLIVLLVSMWAIFGFGLSKCSIGDKVMPNSPQPTESITLPR